MVGAQVGRTSQRRAWADDLNLLAEPDISVISSECRCARRFFFVLSGRGRLEAEGRTLRAAP